MFSRVFAKPLLPLPGKVADRPDEGVSCDSARQKSFTAFPGGAKTGFHSITARRTRDPLPRARGRRRESGISLFDDGLHFTRTISLRTSSANAAELVSPDVVLDLPFAFEPTRDGRRFLQQQQIALDHAEDEGLNGSVKAPLRRDDWLWDHRRRRSSPCCVQGRSLPGSRWGQPLSL